MLFVGTVNIGNHKSGEDKKGNIYCSCVLSETERKNHTKNDLFDFDSTALSVIVFVFEWTNILFIHSNMDNSYCSC